MKTIKVINKYKAKRGSKGIYIGRGSPLGNPFVIGKHGTRDEVIDKYEAYLSKKVQEDDVIIINALSNIHSLSKHYEGVNLLCFCKPLRCHGDVIKQMVLEATYQKGCSDSDSKPINVFKR